MSSLGNKKLYIVWIDKNVFNSENIKYLEQLGYEPVKSSNNNNNNNFDQETAVNIPNSINDKNFPYIIYPFTNIKASICHFKGENYENKEKYKYRFKKTIIIVSGRLFKDIVKEFHKSLKDINALENIIEIGKSCTLLF